MKKYIFVFLLIFISSFSFADLSEVTGHDWLLWSAETQEVYLMGFISAYGITVDKIQYEAEDSGNPLSREELKYLENEYYFDDLTLGDIRIEIDDFYKSDVTYLEYPVYVVLLFVTDKVYWE